MINYEALFKISYGLYIVASGDKEYGNGYISNTVFQVTSEPVKFATCCNKENHTASLIIKHKHFSVSVLHQEAGVKTYGKLGYQSGKDVNKFEGLKIKYGTTGVPIVLDDSVAYLECKVTQTVDVGTHWIFIGELLEAQVTDDSREPITYAYYRNVKKGVAPKNAPTYIDKSKLEAAPKDKDARVYKCLVCGHIYDESKENVKFDDLPNGWKCPVCGADKEDFVIVEQ